jgi:hypothetical protein
MTEDFWGGGGKPPPPSLSVPCLAWRSGEMSASVRAVPEETAVAFTFTPITLSDDDRNPWPSMLARFAADKSKTRVRLPKSVKICNEVIRALFSVDKPNSRPARPLANPCLLRWCQANFRFWPRAERACQR